MRPAPPRWLLAATVLLLLVGALAEVAFVSAMKPSSATAYVAFASWLVLPMLIMGVALLVLHRQDRVRPGWLISVAVVSVLGPLLLADAIFWHPDPQGALAVLMLPLLQGVLLAGLLVLGRLIRRRGSG